ncbi:hypothetical protein FNQ90_25555, partial [Streptomyces alkaliphilus]|nr:hypothetical protein [Streptomyces alkaliphilus]
MYVPDRPVMSLLATLIALAAAVLAVVDLFTNGLWLTALHTAVALSVFGAVRLCVGASLTNRPL